MRSLITLAALSFLLLASACDSGGDGTLQSCATAYVGHFTGARPASVTALLTDAPDSLGEYRVNALVYFDDLGPDDEPYEYGATIDEQGVLTSDNATLLFEGAFDLETCEGRGTWKFPPDVTGEWVLDLRKPASF